MGTPDLHCKDCGWALASDHPAADRSGRDYCFNCENHHPEVFVIEELVQALKNEYGDDDWSGYLSRATRDYLGIK